jgi:hypothetical protein
LLAVPPGAALAQGAASLDFSGGSIAYEAQDSMTLLSITTTEGKKYQISLPRDSNVASGVPPREMALVGQLDGSVLILTDSYPSIAGGLEYCEAGEEKFLRVISLVRKPVTQTYHTKLESCRQNITLADPGVQWSADQQILSIHWSSSRKGVGKPDDRKLKIGLRDVARKK